jgi:hypothetical protein
VVTDELAERFAALTHPPDDSDWPEVRRLARPLRPRRPRLVLAAAAVALGAALAAPAFGLGGKLVRLFESGQPAPPRIQRSFASLDAGAPPGFRTGVVAAETRKLALSQGVALWIAPTSAGGYCLFVAGGGGSCNTRRALEFWPTFSIGGRFSHHGVIRSGPVLIDGSTTLKDAATVEIRFEDGASETVPVVWISEPIDAGFFGYDVPRSKWAVGHRPMLLVLRDADGHELRRDSSAFRAPSFRHGPSTGLASCLFRLGGARCLEAVLGAKAPAGKPRARGSRGPVWRGP